MLALTSFTKQLVVLSKCRKMQRDLYYSLDNVLDGWVAFVCDRASWQSRVLFCRPEVELSGTCVFILFPLFCHLTLSDKVKVEKGAKMAESEKSRKFDSCLISQFDSLTESLSVRTVGRFTPSVITLTLTLARCCY